PHADTDHGDLHYVRVGLERSEADLRALRLQHTNRALEVRLPDREREVGEFSVLGHVLHDHIDIDRMIGKWTEDRRGDAGPIGHLLHSDLRLVAIIGDATYNAFFHDLVLVYHQSSRRVGEARQHLHAHTMVHRHLDRAGLQYLGALGG